ncbi:pre-toxin TG domain-containing protein [Rummeliibacillus pycnus]|uniref:pre-toxin TG domain-containing protein n=1 Tax=Rummeliibacillus pycnus TaxID=101070 RepID=UPI003D2AE9E6
MKLLYEEDKWSKVSKALSHVNEAHKYDNKYENADHLFDDSKKDIAEKDVDGAITFKPQEYQPEAKPIRQDYKKLYDYAKGIGKIIDEKVDTPFNKAIDEYIQKMADLNVTSYSTANTINVQEGSLFSGAKDKITLNDLYDADTTYSANLKTEYEAWKLQNPSEEASEEDYRTASLNSGAFEYEGIRAGQEKKEFWYNLIAAGVVIGLSIVCPPAGLAAGAIYTAIDVAGAVKGEDLISGRKLSDEERLMRGVFAIAPGVGGLAVKSLLKNVPALANVLKTTAKTIDDAVKPLKNTIDGVKIQSKAVYSTVVSNAKKLGGQHVNQLKYALSHPVGAAVTSKTGQKTIRESAKFIDNALRPVHVRAAQTPTGQNIVTGLERGPSKGVFKNKGEDFISRIQTEKEISLKNQELNKLDSFEALMNEEDVKRYNQFWDKTEIGMNTNVRVSTNLQSADSFVNSILPKKLKEHSLSYDDFTNLRLKPDYQLNETEQKIMQDIRNSVVRPDVKTPLIKNIPANDIQKYLDGKYTTVRGFIAKAEDSAHIHDYNHVRESMRLDYSYYDDYKEQIVRPYPEDGNAYGYIEFKAKKSKSFSEKSLEIPYGNNMNNPYRGWEENGWPWTGNGFTSSRNGEVIPEWVFNDFIELAEGAKLHRVINGKDEVISVFNGKVFK